MCSLMSILKANNGKYPRLTTILENVKGRQATGMAGRITNRYQSEGERGK